MTTTQPIVPIEVRREALSAAIEAASGVLVAHRVYFDHLATCELLDETLGEYADALEAHLSEGPMQ